MRKKNKFTAEFKLCVLYVLFIIIIILDKFKSKNVLKNKQNKPCCEMKYFQKNIKSFQNWGGDPLRVGTQLANRSKKCFDIGL